VIVPPMSGNFSAVGFVVADVQHDYVRTLAQKEHEIDPSELLREFLEMEGEGLRQLEQERVRPEETEIVWSADLRYDGQSWELNAPIERTPGEFTEEHVRRIAEGFHDLHQQVYSYSEPDGVVEFVNLRVRVKGLNKGLAFKEEGHEPFLLEDGWKAMREVYFVEEGWLSIPVYEREDLSVGSRIPGPCIIEETISTALVPPGHTGTIDAYRNIVIELEGAA